MSNTCENCRFFYEEVSQTFCRRYPPQATVVPVPVQGLRGMQVQMQSVSGFPVVQKEQSCGEWAVKLEFKSLT